MKKLVIIILVVMAMLMGCREESIKVSAPIIKSVKVNEISNETYQNYERYVGHVTSSGIIKRSFEVDGKVELIDVAIGDVVSEGQLIASVDTEGLKYALDAAKAELSASNAQYQKSLESLKYADELLTNTNSLYTAGVASKTEYDQVKLNYDVLKSDVNSARELKNQAATNVEVKEYMLKQSDIYALKAGVVVDVLLEPGELISAGYPVVILRDIHPVVSFGISQNDLKYIDIGSFLNLTCDDYELTGEILSINQVPDNTTQTYEVELSINKDLPLGSIILIDVPTEFVKGAKIPLGSIRSDGTDFVFIVTDDYVSRVNIEVIAIFNQEVVVSGLPETSTLIVEGILGLTAGDSVKIVED
ncbi:MAG: efflux RND transporter periplasmic adaptor subunit [Clostridiales bacterium]|nr:efflux RND transporter periplasmic adaptor subunit [Clostridiales bacterium]